MKSLRLTEDAQKGRPRKLGSSFRFEGKHYTVALSGGDPAKSLYHYVLEPVKR